MRTTCTVLKGRVAGSVDYIDGVIVNGCPERSGPVKVGGEHLVIEFDLIGDRQVVFGAIRDLDSGAARSLTAWPAPITAALESHCLAYANRHPQLVHAAH